MLTAADLSDPRNINSFISSLVLPLMETYKYRKEVKTFLKYTIRKSKRLYLKVKLKGTKLK